MLNYEELSYRQEYETRGFIPLFFKLLRVNIIPKERY